MSGIDAKYLEELKQKNNIVEVIGGYLPLDRKGGQYWACCPFHHEKTPSFAIREEEQFYHCFGCGESGDVIKFVREIESTDFMGAVRILAGRAKMTVPEGNFDSERSAMLKKKRDELLKILLDAARFYRTNLYEGNADAHLNYIARRALSPTTVKRFGLGASLDFKSLPEYLAGKGYTRENLLDSGVLAESKNGRLVDSQAGRLIIPIINALDEVVAFGGRLLEKSDFAKYKNTKETMVFNKSKTLYNINLLKRLKRTEGIKEVIMVEGYMDTISLYQAGFCNVVASMGTSLTTEQARLVKRYSENILISYDGDFAGQKADLRGLEILKDENLNVRVVPLPDGLDPDDVVKKGKDAYQACLDAAMPLIDYKIHSLENKYDLKKTEDKRNFLSEALKVVRSADSEGVKEELLKKLRDKTGISYTALSRDLENLPKEKAAKAFVGPKSTESETDKYTKAVRFILAAKLFSEPYAEKYSLSGIEFDNDVHKIIAEYISAAEKAGVKVRPSGIFEILDETCPELNAILDLSYEDKLSDAVAERFFLGCVRAIEERELDRKIEECKKQHDEERDTEKRKEIARQLSSYMVQLKKLQRKK